jgi:hypothetical protein
MGCRTRDGALNPTRARARITVLADHGAPRCLDLSGVQLGGRRPRGHTGQLRKDRCDGPRPHHGIHPPRFIDRGQPRAAELHAARLGGCKAGFSAVADHFASRTRVRG